MYIINKADLDGAGQLFQAVQDFIGSVEKNPIILKVSSKTGKGMNEFIKELKISMKNKKKNKKQKENDMAAVELNDIILNRINQKISAMLKSSKSYSTYLKKVQEKKLDPFEASDKISKGLLRG
jgi:LAO/AO transport system kinase